jgi:hypothetical protein
MPEGFFVVPDWFSAENQGAGVAVAEFGDGEQHLVVLMVDNGPQQNRAVYRIGRKLNGGGGVTGGWTPWTDVPDWFSWDNQGADIAVADLAGEGRQDIVVFMIDNGAQVNRGLYRVGKALDADGNVTGGWTPWIDVPDWFSWENQGGGIDVTAPDAQGRRHLIVFMIDNGAQQNRGLYRIGKALDANGNPTGGWTPWIDAPDWFPWENQGGSVAIADLDGDGSQDLIVFMIDNVIQAGTNGGQNQGFIKIGRKLDADGAVAKWDGNWLSLPYWFSWENQGGSIATAKLQGRSKLFSLIVDNPPGKNEGIYQVVDIARDPAVSGRWEPVFDLPNAAIHTNVLPNGKVLFWGRRDDPKGSLDPHSCTTWLWDHRTGNAPERTTNQPTHTNGQTVNLFCSGHAFMPDGRLFVAGGHIEDSDGSDQASIYDYRTDRWEPIPKMRKGRWYPTVTTLADGTMLVTSGSYKEDGEVFNYEVSQIWDGHRWTFINATFNDPDTPGEDEPVPLYPRIHLMSDGRVFMSGSDPGTYVLQPDGTGTWTWLADRKARARPEAPSVMYDTDKVIYIGGGNSAESNIPTADVEIIDLRNNPNWEATARMHFPRRQHNATLLPDGTVLVTGGTMGHGFNDVSEGKPVHSAELWDPRTRKWRMLAAEDVDRCYHATTVLLPDATVLSAGGGEWRPQGPAPNDPEDTHRNAQIFYPPYLFRGARPVIASASSELDYGATFSIQVSGPKIDRVSWVRLPSVTHSFDQNQRINFLNFSSDHGRLTVTAPERPESCPPGHYMLFALSEAGVPSVAHIVRIGPPAPRPRTVTAGPSPGAAAYGVLEGKTPLQLRDEAIRSQSTGTRVTVGLTARCPYGLGACWSNAYEALKKLEGVAAVRTIANAEDSTADVFLEGQELPDLDSWPIQLARWANRSYDFRGVEVTVGGTLRKQDGTLQLAVASLASPITLLPLGQGMKIQWDHSASRPRDAADAEIEAYQRLKDERQGLTLADATVRITGPLRKSGATWHLHVRKFE